VNLYSNRLGVVIDQNTYATCCGSDFCALRKLLDRVELSGRLMRCMRTALFLHHEHGGADFLLAVKHSRRKGFQVIRDRLTYSRSLAAEREPQLDYRELLALAARHPAQGRRPPLPRDQ
jgi:hypothetical protein